MNLTHEEIMLTRRALGLESSKSINRNHCAVHVLGANIEFAKSLAAKGAMHPDPSCDFGSMRVFRVTPAGAKAIGKKLPPAHTSSLCTA
ncbi:hypothetical protein [Bradyrhizobium sp. SZCCHNR3118]|uniref:hypothetical protein n=1 Tax=Bradyrhizobium sp. SZCCHNR3118 TaxID=3057468 RepID=UPI00291661B1|nr:hypothetical protein [Bradyrhizobium sp. SZCCHNR3118]